jgi:hypothetical protein
VSERDAASASAAAAAAGAAAAIVRAMLYVVDLPLAHVIAYVVSHLL